MQGHHWCSFLDFSHCNTPHSACGSAFLSMQHELLSLGAIQLQNLPLSYAPLNTLFRFSLDPSAYGFTFLTTNDSSMHSMLMQTVYYLMPSMVKIPSHSRVVVHDLTISVHHSMQHQVMSFIITLGSNLSPMVIPTCRHSCHLNSPCALP